MPISALTLDASGYERSPLHRASATWSEKNCYADVWIEMLHVLGLDPIAAMPFTLRADFEGDQWTFYKPSHDELFDLYGVVVEELTVWKPLLEHALEHLAAGKLIITESDAYWLPDTAGTDYRTKHTKTTISLNEIDVDQRRLGYFHGPGYFVAQGEDFDRLFGLHAPAAQDFMPLFAEWVRLDRVRRRPSAELRAMSRKLVVKHFNRRPATNPIIRFRERLERDLPELHAKGIAYYHAWAFATTRQLGSAFELAALNLAWLAQDPSGSDADVSQAAEAFDLISQRCKMLILKGARMVAGKRPLTDGAVYDEMAAAWDRGMTAVSRAKSLLRA